MQQMKKRRSRLQAILILIGLFALIAALIVCAVVLFTPKAAVGIITNRLPCQYSETIKPFGDYVLYYDGLSLHCMTTSGSVRWSFPIGGEAGFDCNEKVVAAWIGSTIYLLDRYGNATYNDRLSDNILFARAGEQYVAIVIGDETSSRLMIKDHTGAHMDEEADAFENLIILDVGFYGKNGEYMWSLALDVFGTAANTTMNTYEVGKRNTGAESLGEYISYKVVYENTRLRVISTRTMKSFSYNFTEDPSQSVLVYGWKLIGHEVPARGDALLLFAPTSQTTNLYDIHELRLIYGKNDRRYSLPQACIGALVWHGALYAVSPTAMYCAGLSNSSFLEYPLNLPSPATRYIGNTQNGRAIVACGEEVYTVSLPAVR